MTHTDQPADKHIREQSVDIQQSFIVSAPAGSGKTGLLTLRVLKLLSVVQKPEEVLCITFTRKAANEMRERIFKALHSAQDSKHANEKFNALDTYQQHILSAAQAALANSERLEWNLLATPYRLNISTIDGFSKYLCNQLPFFSGLGAESNIIENPAEEYAHTVDQWLFDAYKERNTDALNTLVKHLSGDFNRLKELLVKMLGLRDQWLPLVMFSKASQETIRHYFENTIATWVEESINRCAVYLAPYEAELCDLIQYAAENIGDAKQANIIATLSSHTEFPKFTPGEENYWQALAQFCLTNDGQFRKRLDKNIGFPTGGSNKDGKAIAQAKKSALQNIFSELSESELNVDDFAALRHLPNVHYTDNQWQVLQALLDILPLLAAELKLRFTEIGKADFTDFSLGAVSALNRNIGDMELLQRLDYRIQHILIDEFQDTSQTQLDLLQALTQEWLPDDGRTLFLVGDGMQSCYSFRNANVGIFLNLREHGLENINSKAINLSVNFRSTTKIVDWVNHIFEQSFPDKNDANIGAVKYIPSGAFKADSHHSYVRTIAFDDNEKNITEAEFIAIEAKKIHTQFPTESIAVLAKSRRHLALIVTEFKSHGVEYQAVEIDALAGKQHIVDLTSLTKVLYSPEERIAWLALLRSPYCALNHNDLFVIFASQENAQTTLPINLCRFALTHHHLSEQGKKRLTRFIHVISPYIEHRQHRGLAESIETLWLKLGGPEALTNETDYADVRTYLRLLNAHEKSSTLEEWSSFESALLKLYASSNQYCDNPVQLMTMHKSKGLEFDTVFLPSLEKGRRAADTDVLYWLERLEENQHSNFILSPVTAKSDAQSDPLTDFIKRQRAKKTTLEDTRVFYVACTRSKQRLYLTCTLKQDEEGVLKPPISHSLMAKIWPYVGENIERIDIKTKTSPSHVKLLDSKPSITALPDSWCDTLSESLQAPSPEIFDNTSFHPLSNLEDRNQLAIAKGKVFHRVLNQMCLSGVEKYTNAKIDSMPVFWANQLRQEGLSTATAQHYAVEFAEHVKQLVNDTTACWILNNTYVHSACEWALHSHDEKGYREHVIDRTFIDNNVRWLIDYKTSTPESEQPLDDFIQHELHLYREQLMRYRALLIDFDKNSYEDNRPDSIKIGLYFPFVQHFAHINDMDFTY